MALAEEARHHRDILSQLTTEITDLNAMKDRMSRIIDRQQKIIRSMNQHHTIGEYSGRLSNHESASDSENLSIPYSSQSDFPSVQPPPIETSFIPPWNVDMDDNRRQLDDLDDSVYKVEQLKDRLVESVIDTSLLETRMFNRQDRG